MKTIRFPILLAALVLLPILSSAQTSGVPDFISYQGEVLDGTGAPVGTGTPVNRTVTFRIWDHPSNVLQANLIYSEQQTVTISDGQFSVLVGQGVGTVGTQFGYSETNKGPQGAPVVKIAAAFGDNVRYLGVTVDDGTAAVDNEITPRQQIVSSAFAFRAKEAETVINNAIGTGSIANSAVNSSKIEDLSVATADLANTSVTLSKIAANAVDSSKILDGSVALADLAANSVDSGKIVNGTIVNADIASNAAIADTKLGTIGTAGKVADTALSANVALLNRNPQTFTGAINSFNGKVGIGTSNPQNTLDVNGFVRAYGANSNFSLADNAAVQRGALGVATNGGAFSTDAAVNDLVLRTEGGKLLLQSGAGASAIAIAANNNVGIGTKTPTQAKLVVSGFVNSTVQNSYGYFGRSDSAHNFGPIAQNYSIWASNFIACAEVNCFSDERIKHVEGRSDSAHDLATILGIQVTDYTYIDKIGKGAGKQKKVIAQQVEAVFPQAVSKATDVVPDIYQKATQQDGWVQLATDFKVGERVRLIGEKEEGIHEVLEVRKDAFRTAFKPEGDKVFVYGREVKDFRSVDYEAISMLNVSATQELARQLEQQKTENAELKARLAEQAKDLAALKAKDEARDTKLAAIEAMLSADPPTTRTVSLKQDAARVE